MKEKRNKTSLVGLDHPDAGNAEKVGNKFSGIARLHALGLNVPSAFSIPSYVIAGIQKEKFIETPSLDDIVREAETVLSIENGIAVRSSGIEEDLETESGAGKYLTILDIRDPGLLRQSISRVLEQYESTLEKDTKGSFFSIILQQMVHPSISGVVFSRHPLRFDEDIVVLEAVEGLGDKLVSGGAQPVRLEIGSEIEPGQSLYSTDGKAVASREQLIELRERARDIEREWGTPVDIEFAIEGERVFFLQARPQTSFTESRPGGRWTRAIAEDLWGDQLCPIDASLLITLAPEFDMRDFARRLGVHVDDHERTLEVIEDYLYVNVDMLERVVHILPRNIEISFIKSLLPPDSRPTPQGKLFPFLFKIVKIVLFNTKANPLFCPGTTKREIRKITGEVAGKPIPESGRPAELASQFEFLVSLLGRLLSLNQMPYCYAFLFTWLIEHYLKGTDMSGGLSVLSGCGDNPTYRMNTRIVALGELVSMQQSSGDGMQRQDGVVSEAASDFLRDFGICSDSRSLVAPRWLENPDKVLEMAKATAKISSPPEEKPSDFHLPIIWRYIAAMARRYLDLREELRHVLDRLLWEMRKVLLEIEKVSELEDSVFSYHYASIISMAREHTVVDREKKTSVFTPGWKSRASHYPPRFFVDRKAIIPQTGISEWQGTPTSKGRTRARARVVASLDEAIRGEQGEIMVTRSMGPSWTVILTRVAGVILTEGSLLDHFSIVAREHNIPCVVGVGPSILDHVDGATVEMDGYEGKVWISD